MIDQELYQQNIDDKILVTEGLTNIGISKKR